MDGKNLDTSVFSVFSVVKKRSAAYRSGRAQGRAPTHSSLN